MVAIALPKADTVSFCDFARLAESRRHRNPTHTTYRKVSTASSADRWMCIPSPYLSRLVNLCNGHVAGNRVHVQHLEIAELLDCVGDQLRIRRADFREALEVAVVVLTPQEQVCCLVGEQGDIRRPLGGEHD